MALTPYASADDLATGDLDLEGEDLKLPSGRLVRVRGLSRQEIIGHGQDGATGDLIERRNILACLLQPKMTPAQVERWQKTDSAGGDLRVLSEKIRDLSGLGQGAQKSRVAPAGD